MAGPFVQSEFYIELADDSGGSPGTYTQYRTQVSSISFSGGDRTTGQITVAGRVNPHTAVGKRQPLTVTVRILYLDGASDLVKDLKTDYENATKKWMRLVPFNNVSVTDTGYQIGPGYVQNLQVPNVDSSSGDPISTEATFYMDGYTIEVVDTTGF